jgi:hypothetical protein
MFMKELQQDLEEKEQMDILFIPFVSEMGNPCISVCTWENVQPNPH